MVFFLYDVFSSAIENMYIFPLLSCREARSSIFCVPSEWIICEYSWLCLVGPSSAAFHWLSNSAKSILPSYISISYQRDFHRFSQPCLHYVLRTGTSLRYKVWLATLPSYLLLRLHDFYVLCIKRILFLACWENIRGPSHNVMLSPSLHRQHILSWRWISTIRWLSR